jgi:hypothetical protein
MTALKRIADVFASTLFFVLTLKKHNTRWVKLDYLNFNIIYWSVKDKFIDKLD